MAISLVGCQSSKAAKFDQHLMELELDKVEKVTITMGPSLEEMMEQMSALSQKEQDSLKFREHLLRLYEQYQTLEAETVTSVESQISQLPQGAAVGLSSEEQIQEARKSFSQLPQTVRKKVSNLDLLTAAEETLEQVKEACWVKCQTCGGDGKIACRLCNGSGSRKVNHTTPNGKTWQVYQDCRTTQSCGVCGGKGGSYEE